MKKLPLVLIIFFSLTVFLVNVKIVYPMCSESGYDAYCEGDCPQDVL